MFEFAVTPTLPSAVALPPEMNDSTVLPTRLMAAEPAMPTAPPPEPPADTVEIVEAESDARVMLPAVDARVAPVLDARMVLAMSL